MNIRITDSNGAKPKFVQWDVDRVLNIYGCDTQPFLHFWNGELTRAIVVPAEAEDGHWTCRVPNFVLQFPLPVIVDVFVQPDEGRSVYRTYIQIVPKTKPQDYTYEENIGYVNWVQKSEEAQALIDEIQEKLDRGDFKGDSYVLTAADRAEIAGIASDDVLVVSDEEPTGEPLPKIWIDSDDDNTILIPTMDDIGDLSDLTTTAKSNLVAAINEAAQSGGSGGGAVSSVNGKTGAVVLNASDVGAGTYSKPSGGIPKTDLASAVQTSLGKADTALQSYTETDPTVPSWAKQSSKPAYTASEVGAIAAPASPATGAFLVWNGTAWVAQTLSTWQGGNY